MEKHYIYVTMRSSKPLLRRVQKAPYSQPSAFWGRRWTAMRTRNGGSHQFHGPDMYGNGKSYGRYLYSVRHVFGEAFKLWSRETVVDEDYTMVCAWQFLESQKEQYTTFGVLRFEPGENVLAASYVE